MAIAVALVKIAFFPANANEAQPVEPQGTVSDTTVTAQIASIKNDIVLDAAVVADDAAGAKSTVEGDVSVLFVKNGAAIGAGERILEVRQEVTPAETTVDEEGKTHTTKARYRFTNVVAPTAGTITGLTTVVGQSVAPGDVVAKVSPNTFSVTATIKPEQQYLLLQQPKEASVTVVGGPDAFTCTGVTIGATVTAGSGDGEGEAATGTGVRCAVPANVRVFAGLTGKLSLPGSSADNVVTLPVTAVKGSSQQGTVWLMGEEGKPVETSVKLGITNGTLVHVSEGLAEGAEVMEFIPVADPSQIEGGENGEECFEENGQMICPTVNGYGSAG